MQGLLKSKILNAYAFKIEDFNKQEGASSMLLKSSILTSLAALRTRIP